jgi:L-asparagine oxygenase
MQNIELSAPQRHVLARALRECGSLGEDPEPFLASVFAKVGCLPADLIRALLRFRADPAECGIMRIQGMPLDDPLPRTPVAAEPVDAKPTFISEGSVLMVAMALGEPLAYEDEKGGVLVQNVYPVRSESQSPSNESSATDLGFHTELAFSRRNPHRALHEACPDFLLLLGLRGAPHDDAVTTLVEGRDICRLLSPRGRRLLMQPLFQLRAPYSFTRGMTERPWSRPVPLLHGTESGTTLAFDLACGVRGTAPDAQDAIDELRQIVSDEGLHRRVRLAAGDLLVVDNRKCAHARSRFEARFDGSDRWLQRVYVRRSLDGLAHASARSFRVL